MHALQPDPLFAIARLDEAYAKVHSALRHRAAASDIWDLRQNWPLEREDVFDRLVAGTYRLSPMRQGARWNGDLADVWSSRDAVVLEFLAKYIGQVLPRSQPSTNVKGNRGLKDVVRRVAEAVPLQRFVLCTDVKSYYASIDHDRLLRRLEVHIEDRRVLNLVAQFLERTADSGRPLFDADKGLATQCALSHVMGAFFCYELDYIMELEARREALTYVRYMDDILVLAPTPWALHVAVSTVNHTLSGLGLGKLPDKLFVGPIERGFVFPSAA